MSSPAMQAREQHRTDIKETITSVIISFAMAFLFRGFVVEAFLIPTGSMAPTLRGQHYQFRSPETGYEWAVGPQDSIEINGDDSLTPIKPGAMGVDTNSNIASVQTKSLRAGDRIFVMKYLYSIYDPKRYDVVVFKNPNDPTMNFIKRLIALPNEQVALVDGDVFVRTPEANDDGSANAWALAGWKAAHKPEMAQRAMWLDIFDSRYTPPGATTGAWQPPWIASDQGTWDFSRPGGEYGVTPPAGGTATLSWDHERRPIFDAYPYNQVHSSRADEQPIPGLMQKYFPVSDLRVSMGVRPLAAGAKVGASIFARRHEFRCDLDAGSGAYTLRMRPVPLGPGGPTSGPDLAQAGPWQEVAAGSVGTLSVGRVVNVEFWHVDQTLQLWIDGRRVAMGEYAWSPQERIQNVLGVSLAEVMASPGLLRSPMAYQAPRVRWDLGGAPMTLYRVALSRDIHYQADEYPPEVDRKRHSMAGRPALATAPSSTLRLDKDQFFVCGDNSPNSLDARKWDAPNPWVAQLDPTMGVVNRDLLIGKAFFVYFPAPQWPHRVPMIDFGKMRWIW